MMMMASAGEPYDSWWDLARGALVLPVVCGALAGLLFLIVRLARQTGVPAAAMQLRLEAKCLRVTPALLVIAFSLLSAAMFAGTAAISLQSTEILAGEENRNEGRLVLGGATVLCALLAIGSGLLFPSFRKRANHLDAMRRSHCGQCGYDLTGMNAPTCPECGHTP